MKSANGQIILNDHARLKIGRRHWKLATAPLKQTGNRGVCLTPKKRGLPGVIVVSTHLKPGGPLHTEAVLHETLHAIFPKMSEKAVRRTSGLLAQSLRKFKVRPPVRSE